MGKDNIPHANDQRIREFQIIREGYLTRADVLRDRIGSMISFIRMLEGIQDDDPIYLAYSKEFNNAINATVTLLKVTKTGLSNVTDRTNKTGY